MKTKIENKFAKLKFNPQAFELEALRAIVQDNHSYFSVHKNTESSQLSYVLQKLNLHLEKLSDIKLNLENAAKHYDYDENTPGNGFWTFLHMFKCGVDNVQKICSGLTKNREKMLFNKSKYSNDLDLWNDIFESLIEICDVILKIHDQSDKKCLCTTDSNWSKLNQLLASIKQKSFYGSALGFQGAKSMKIIVRVMVSSLVGYSKFHFSDKHKSIRLLDFNFSTSKYFLKPKHRAHKFVLSTDKGDVEFCKSFWTMTEIGPIHTLPNVLSQKIEVNKLFKIPAEPMQIFSTKYQKLIDIPVPHSHFETKPVSCRLMSAQKYSGMMNKTTQTASKALPKSKHLLFHAHGGGWAAQTSKSHEVYMKQWACHIKCPILSIDYSLAPMAPFPRAIEEIFYAYCWALKNLDSLGTTGDRIVFAGDSAGANLVTAVLIKCIEEGVRLPDGIVNIYGIFDVGFMISPSGCLTLIDPILPFSMTSNLIKSYGMDYQSDIDTNGNIEKFNFIFKKSHLLSPSEAPDEILKQIPKIVFVSPILCPLMDNSVDFAKKLRELDVNVHVDMIDGLYHGFLYFIKFSKECRDASLLCADHIRKLLEAE